MKQPRRLLLRASPLICFLVLTLFYTKFFDSNIIFSNGWIQKWSNKEVSQEIEVALRRLVRGEDLAKLKETGFSCDSALHSLVCVSTRLVRIETKSLTVHVPTYGQTVADSETLVRPFSKQENEGMMKYISPVHMLQENIKVTPLPCEYNHTVPAIIFSTGFPESAFHDLSDVIIPLFLTSRHFQSRVRFIAFDYNLTFINKYNTILSRLSSYEVMNQDSDKGVHCFPGVVVGLKFHDSLALNSSDIPGGYSMPEFRQFLRESFNLKFKNVKQIKRPVLIFVSRRKTRVILNENELIGMMKEVGFKVIIAKVENMKNLDKFAQVVNSCNIMVGVHGAGLTNEIFLPSGAVMVQIALLGQNWISEHHFGIPAQPMGIKYLQYEIEQEESTLINEYEPNDPVLTNPESMWMKKGFDVARDIFVHGQNVTVNLSRFKPTLVEALGFLRQSNPMN